MDQGNETVGIHDLKPSLRYTAEEMADRIRLAILDESHRANVGHIGSALSVADLVASIYTDLIRVGSPDDADRDRFALSKGHAALALYAALYCRGWISAEQIGTYCGEGTLLGVHPEAALHGVDFTTGSLGQGLSFATGAALAARLDRSTRRVYALISDAECNEGSIWESALFARQRGLGNLVVFVDRNGQQALGYTADVMDLAPLQQKWASFGWDAHEVDGHDTGAITALASSLDTRGDRPHVIVARTTFGYPVSFMQNRIAWHYLPMDSAQYVQARREIGHPL